MDNIRDILGVSSDVNLFIFGQDEVPCEICLFCLRGDGVKRKALGLKKRVYEMEEQR